MENAIYFLSFCILLLIGVISSLRLRESVGYIFDVAVASIKRVLLFLIIGLLVLIGVAAIVWLGSQYIIAWKQWINTPSVDYQGYNIVSELVKFKNNVKGMLSWGVVLLALFFSELSRKRKRNSNKKDS